MVGTELPRIPVVIIGSGFSGLAMGAQLKRKLNFEDYVIYERLSHFGGTWFANTYPGCGVDIPSILYSLSFAPNPDFTNFFPYQPEILEYLESIAKRFGVDKHIKLNTNWDGAVWKESSKTWLVSLSDVRTGEQFTQECSVLISATGALVNPNPCDIPGADKFKGSVVHTAKWQKDIVLEGKNVVVIGNGCSATQVVPAIASKVNSIHQFMRTPQFFLPRPNPSIPPLWKLAFRYVPFLLTSIRCLLFNRLEYRSVQLYMTARGEQFRVQSKQASDDYVEATAPAEYWDMLKPKYLAGCKRRVFDPGYLASLNRENVHLTDDPITEIEETGVLTKSGRHYPADVIILATGFNLSQYNANLVGKGGVTPEEHWAQFGGIEAYKSTACSAFPNFFFLFGPNSATGHTSALFAIESVVDLILKVARPVIAGQAADVEVKYDHEKEYSDKQQAALAQRVWATCKSWYKDKNGWNFTMYPYSMYTLWWQTRFPIMNAWTYNKLKQS